MNEWLYYEDSFTINDSVVRKVLPYYLAYYKIDKSLWYGKNLDDLSYVEFFRLFNALKDLILEMNINLVVNNCSDFILKLAFSEN